MAERSKALDSKSSEGLCSSVGSNPTSSAITQFNRDSDAFKSLITLVVVRLFCYTVIQRASMNFTQAQDKSYTKSYIVHF